MLIDLSKESTNCSHMSGNHDTYEIMQKSLTTAEHEFPDDSDNIIENGLNNRLESPNPEISQNITSTYLVLNEETGLFEPLTSTSTEAADADGMKSILNERTGELQLIQQY